MLYKMQHFISYEEFKLIFNQQFEGEPAESSFLKLKSDVSSNYGPIVRKKKYPPPNILNKNVPTWIFQTPLELFEKTKRGSKITGTSLGNIRLGGIIPSGVRS